MNKIYIKLIAISLTLVLAVSMVVLTSYAWFVLSGSPEVAGIQVSIGGGNTILIAPDIRQEVDGVVYHYPGGFSDKLHFSQHESYAYLQQLGGLTPVSTANGIDWYLPAYYTYGDEQVRQGKAFSGQLKDVSEFVLDYDLSHANLPAEEEDLIQKGSYVYLDFWVVSPGSDYTLRVSKGDENGGSFLIDLMQPMQTESGYVLAADTADASGAVRVGFLANDVKIVDDTMLHYQNSGFFQSQYTSLRGVYMEPHVGSYGDIGSRFTIFEPNGDLHPNGMAEPGSYVLTQPLAKVNDVATPVSIQDRLTVQLASRWTAAENGAGTMIEQIFQAAVRGMDTQNMESTQISQSFYQEYLQGQLNSYVEKGSFVKRTSELYAYENLILPEQLGQLDTAGATDDVYIIKLEKNIPQRIRLFVWLEGQDVDCINEISASSFFLSLELAGGSE